MVHNFQGPHHDWRLWDPWWDELGIVLSVTSCDWCLWPCIKSFIIRFKIILYPSVMFAYLLIKLVFPTYCTKLGVPFFWVLYLCLLKDITVIFYFNMVCRFFILKNYYMLICYPSISMLVHNFDHIYVGCYIQFLVWSPVLWNVFQSVSPSIDWNCQVFNKIGNMKLEFTWPYDT